MKKGFTLIELLAVIVILAIIALIATPIILNIIDDAREESNKRSIDLYANAANNAVAAYQLKNKKSPSSFSDLTIEYNGNVSCKTSELYEDGNIYLADCTVNGTLVEGYTYGEEQKSCIYNDKDNSGTINLSDEVTCGTESFYVMSNKSGNVNMLPAYNLTLSTTSPIQDTTGAANGIAFSSTNYFYDETNYVFTVDTDYVSEGRAPYIYGNYEENLVYPYVEAYREILEGMGVNVIDAKLLSVEQAIALGCHDDVCDSAPSWLYSSTYWMGSAFGGSPFGVDCMTSNALFLNYCGYGIDYADDVGIRPVITILETEIG